MTPADKAPSIRSTRARAVLPDESIDSDTKAVHTPTDGRSTEPVSAQERMARMAYVTQDKFNEAIDHLGHHIDRRLTALETEVKSLRTDMVQGFEKVDQRFEAIDQRFEAIDQRFEAIDQRFEAIDQRFENLEGSLAASNKVHNDNHLELKQMLGVLLQEIRSK
ncbi:hypothetical protein GAY29_05130 [Azospirillum brasilense]|uniref:hypothetical protein n=1 Tax=Azospirillum brasilense TaxID=192 RepID=UPI00190B0FCA|nr:hypothetical protein [Azospirillum brasilense]MBK3732496.1 hypothetical protein [Azospirillum brasilense]